LRKESRKPSFAVAVGFLALGALPVLGAAKPAGPPPPTPAEIRQAVARLAELGYWAGPVDGRRFSGIDEATRGAIVAFQKVDGRKPTGQLTRRDLEFDLGRQVLFFVDADGKVANILPISSGSGRTFHEAGYPETHALTPCGHLEVFSKGSGWKKSPLGEMFNPLYIVGGIAIHGSLDVPAHPASHGCIRVPMFAAYKLPRMVPLKTPVLVYGCPDETPPSPLNFPVAAGEPQ
jgi:L,D-transpeptidase catalytic domain/Putative peptidoglycan binding domain